MVITTNATRINNLSQKYCITVPQRFSICVACTYSVLLSDSLLQCWQKEDSVHNRNPGRPSFFSWYSNVVTRRSNGWAEVLIHAKYFTGEYYKRATCSTISAPLQYLYSCPIVSTSDANHMARYSSIHTSRSRSTAEGTLRKQRYITQEGSFRLKSIDHAELGATVGGIVEYESQQKDNGTIRMAVLVAMGRNSFSNPAVKICANRGAYYTC